MAEKSINHILHNLDPRRDSYGFALRPQHTHRYREYASIYKEEEAERSNKWKSFLDQVAISCQACPLDEGDKNTPSAETSEQKEETDSRRCSTGDDSTDSKVVSIDTADSGLEKLLQPSKEKQARIVQSWCQIRPSLNAIETMMRSRVRKGKTMEDQKRTSDGDHPPSVEDLESIGGVSVANFEEEEACVNGALKHSMSACEVESREDECILNSLKPSEGNSIVADRVSQELLFPWKEELECLVRGGLPKDLRGEVWQAFVGVKTRRTDKYYQDLLDQETNFSGDNNSFGVPIKLKKQIEKVIRCMRLGLYHSIFLI